jgi:hypothetical protein
MSKEEFTPERIIWKLREAEVALAQRQTTGQVCRTDLPPWIIPELKLELGLSQPRDPGGE